MFSAAIKTAAASGGYQISRSLRFNSADTTFLNRTPASAGNRTTWTWSAWVKRGAVSNLSDIFSTTSSEFFFNTNDTLNWFDNAGYYLTTTQVFRDPSAWYHFVFVWNTTSATSSDRVQIYVNGVLITAFTTASYPAQNTNSTFNNNVAHSIGRYNGGSQYFNGYMTEVNFIDGQALTPSSFGETNSQTGVWQPKAYTGTYGTNGFYLNFSDNSNTTAATLGKDYSGNGNNWTPNNFSVSAGAGNDSLVDTPTPYVVDTGAGGNVRGNYCTNNPLDTYTGLTSANGNLDLNYTTSETAWRASRATIGVSSGKWYWEVLCNNVAAPSGDPRALLGIMTSRASLASFVGSDAFGWGYYSHGDKYTNGSGSGGGIASYQTGDLIGFAFDADAGTLTFYKNGSSVTSFTGLSANTYFPAFSLYGSNAGSISINFGQRPFAYTAPSGFRALCTQNLPTPAIGATTATQAGKYFNPVLWTGNSSTQNITGVGFEADFIWMKNRSVNGRNHYLFDRLRGITNARLFSNLTDAESTSTTYINSTNSDGYQLSSGDAGSNASGETYVGWNWKANGAGSSNTAGSITSTVSANTTSGFSIVTYTGTGANATVGHGLGVAPSMVIQKYRSSATSWFVYHVSAGTNKYLTLNTTDAAITDTGIWQNTAPTSSVFSVGAGINGNGSTMVAYCFAEVPGFSKFGSYVGNGSSDGPFVFCGFRPAYVLMKRTDGTSDWDVFDNKRSGYNVKNDALYPNASYPEDSGSTYTYLDLTSNGFKIRSSVYNNASGGTYIFMAFAENPFKYSLAR